MKNPLQSIQLLVLVLVLVAGNAEGQTTTHKPTTANKPTQSVVRNTPSATKPAVAKATPSAQPISQPKPVETSTKPTITASTNQSTAQPQPTASAAPKAGAAQAVARKQPLLLKPGHRESYLNGGIGLASYWGGGIPIGVSFETTIAENLSVGGSVDYSRYGRNYGGYKWSYNFIYAGARGSYHFGELLETGSKFDPYAGLSLGFRMATYKDNSGYTSDYYSPYNNGLYLGLHVGGRYYFTEKVGGFAEVGYGVTALRLGITAKF